MELSCPQCGLMLAMPRLQIEYCPRCIARRRQPVPLVAESLTRVRRDGRQADERTGGALKPGPGG